jgi:hypothetical protein
MELQKLENGYTLKMFADNADLDIKHKNALRDFRRMVDNMENRHRLKFEPISYKDSYGRTQETISMDKKTALWFASKFDEDLRFAIIELVEDQTEKLIQHQQIILERQSKHKLVTYSDGTESLRKIIRTYYPDVLGEREAWRHLVKLGIVKYEPKTTYVKVLLNNDYGIQEQDSIRWNDKLCELLDKLADKKDIGE